MIPFSSMSTALIRPARPALPPVWPMFPFLDPIGNSWPACLFREKAEAIALTSIGSPVLVPEHNRRKEADALVGTPEKWLLVGPLRLGH